MQGWQAVCRRLSWPGLLDEWWRWTRCPSAMRCFISLLLMLSSRQKDGLVIVIHLSIRLVVQTVLHVVVVDRDNNSVSIYMITWHHVITPLLARACCSFATGLGFGVKINLCLMVVFDFLIYYFSIPIFYPWFPIYYLKSFLSTLTNFSITYWKIIITFLIW